MPVQKIYLTLSILFVFLVGIGSVFATKSVFEQRLVHSSTYGFPLPYLHDYFQYISMIKNGQQGTLLFHNQFTEENFPPLLLQPHYHLIGLLSSPFHIDQFATYFYAKLFFAALLFLTTIVLIQKIIPYNELRALANILFITATSIYHYELVGNVKSFLEPYSASDWFNVFTKTTLIHAHHYLAITILFLLLFFSAKRPSVPKFWGLTYVLALALVFIHPYVSYVLLLIFLLQSISSFFFNRSSFIGFCMHTGAAIAASLPNIFYIKYILETVWKGETQHVNSSIVWSPPIIPFESYLLNLSPLVFISLITLFQKDTWKKPERSMLVFWAYVPLLFFYLPNIGIPTGGMRLFQTYQHIPLALLSSLALIPLYKYLKKYFILLSIAGAAVSIAYAVPAYQSRFEEFTAVTNRYYNQITMLQLAQPALTFLSTQTPPNSVVATGETIGMMIPAFTNNRVILGHEGNNPDYLRKRNELWGFLGGYVPEANLPAFLDAYHIDYVLYGVDALAFQSMPYASLPYFVPVFESPPITIVKIDRTKFPTK